jgi:hypothetical protein
VLAPPSHMTTDGDHNLHQKVFQRFAFRRFDISVVKCFDTPSHEPRNFRRFTFRRFGISVLKCFDTPSHEPQNFRRFAFRRFDISVLKCFDTPSHEPQNFRRFAFRNFGTPVMKSLDSSCCDRRNSEIESDQRSTILMVRRSRSFRDFAYREFLRELLP